MAIFTRRSRRWMRCKACWLRFENNEEIIENYFWVNKSSGVWSPDNYYLGTTNKDYYHIKCWPEYRFWSYIYSIFIGLFLFIGIFAGTMLIMVASGKLDTTENSTVYPYDATKVRWEYYNLAIIICSIVVAVSLAVVTASVTLLIKKKLSIRAKRLEERNLKKQDSELTNDSSIINN